MSKKKSAPTFERKDWVETIIDCKGKITIHVHPDESVSFENEMPGHARMVRTYDRPTGKEKQLLSIPLRDSRPTFDPLENLKRQFDHLLAIDTNYREIHGRWTAATVAYRVPKPLNAYAREIPYEFAAAFIVVDEGKVQDFEERGWSLILDQVLERRYFTASGARLGLVTDHGLGKHKEINEKRTPYFKTDVLPDFATLLYASDASADGLPNQMIQYCDRVASSLLVEHEKRALQQPTPIATSFRVTLLPAEAPK
jgi:hypothetical protein